MKCIRALLLSAALVHAADFNTGQAARALIGQRTFTAQGYGASDELVGAVSGLACANDTLFVADSSRVSGAQPANHRLLIFKNLSAMLPAPAAITDFSSRCPVCVGKAGVVLGQPDFTKTDFAVPPTRASLRLPTAVATDGRLLAIADTDNNRVLIWNSIPNTNGAPADVVVGQTDFNRNTLPPGNLPNSRSMRGPQGVWIQNGKLYVADTQNHRVLIYNSVPTSNGAAADIVLGQPDFSTFVEPDLTQQKVDAKPTNLLNPVSVTSDGQRLYVTDLGHNRVLVWNSLPTRNQESADLAIGQPDLTKADPNNAPALCEPTGKKDDKGNDTFPPRCNATLSFPRFALSDGNRLFIADGGNDRVLIFSHVPTRSGEQADYIIGQLGGQINQASDSTDSLRTPMSLAWDGANLYVSDSFNRRITVYSPGENVLPYTAARNAASLEIFAVGTVAFSGSVKENDEVTIKINDKEYKYKIAKDDTFAKVILALVSAINAGEGDPNVFASPNPVVQGIVLTARAPGDDGNQVSYSTSTSSGATITATAGGANLSGGQDAAKIAPGTIVTVKGDRLSDDTAAAPLDRDALPTEMGGTRLYLDGVPAPLFYVSPKQINAQVPFEFLDATSINAYVRVKHADGSVSVTTPVAVTIVPQNPGIFAEAGTDPRPGLVLHSSSNATGTVLVDGTAKAGDAATVTIEDRSYSYTVKDGDTLDSIRDALVSLINDDPKVFARPAGVFSRILLRARVLGPEGNGIPYAARANDGAQVILTPTGQALCCANVAGSRVTNDNPAIPGETIVVYATGLGLPLLTDEVKDAIISGVKYKGPQNLPAEFVSSLGGGKTANVLLASLKKGEIGVYEVYLELNSDIPTNPFTQLTIAQNIYVSNIITFPVVNPNPPVQ
jgi:hypothetical protein